MSKPNHVAGMTSADHIHEAETSLAYLDRLSGANQILLAAQVHATLALAKALTGADARIFADRHHRQMGLAGLACLSCPPEGA